MRVNEYGECVLSESEQQLKRAAIAAMREIADYLERHPGPPMHVSVCANYFAVSAEELLAVRRAYALSQKDTSSGNFAFERKFPQGFYVRVFSEREIVCKRVKTGQQLLPAEPEKVIPAKPEKVVDVYEWVCPESVLAETNGQAIQEPEPQPAA